MNRQRDIPLSQNKTPLSTKRVKVVHDQFQVYVEGEEGRGQGPSPIEAWRDLLSKGGVVDKWQVLSASKKGVYHTVDLNDPNFPKCGCEQFFYRCLNAEGDYTGGICRHIEACLARFAERQRKR
jgi:hypothetical protein